MEPSAGKKEFIRSLYFPSLLLAIIWAVKGIEILFGTSFATLGIYPRSTDGLAGIIFAPLIHANFSHLISNSIPLFLLSVALFYFYRPLALEILILIWLVTGICVWIGAREAYHIGASGVIYGEASFLFFSGIFRRNVKLTAISLLVIFLYGGMVWGIFPIMPQISWESHLFGGLSGFTFAIIYKKDGPSDHDSDDEDEDEDDFPYWQDYGDEELD